MWLLNLLSRLRLCFPVYLAPDRSQLTNSDFIQEDYTKAFEEAPTPVTEEFPEAPEPMFTPFIDREELDPNIGPNGPYDGRPRQGHGVITFGPADLSRYDGKLSKPPTAGKGAPAPKITAPTRNAQGQYVKRL